MSDKVVDLEKRREPESPLDHLERTLPPGEPQDQVKAIMEMRDPVGFLQSLDSHTFYQLIKGAGWDQTYDLIQYAEPRQIQNFLDFDCWTRDRLIPDKMEKWLVALVTEATDDKLREVARNLDPEVLAIYFKAHLHVEELDEGRIPDDLEGNIATSPDGVYAIVYPDDEDKSALLRALLERLYAADRVLAWTLLEAVRWELMSEMEEFAYKWRNSRLEEYGFVTRDEAVEVYSYVDPARYREKIDGELKPDEHLERLAPDTLDLPAVLEDELDDEFYAFRAVSKLVDPEVVQRIFYQIAALTNRTMIADGIDPGEVESGRQVIRRTLGYLSLGLEFLSRADLDLAGKQISYLPVKRIFQVGFSLPRKLQARLESLEHRPTLSIVEGDKFSLLDADERALAESLARPRPTFAWDQHNYEIFKSQDQLDSAAFRIGMIAFKQVWLFAVLRETLEALAEVVYSDQTVNEPPAVTFDTLFTTWVANFLLGGEATLRPLRPGGLKRLTKVLRQAPWDDKGKAYFKPLLDEVEDSVPVASNRLFIRWVNQSIERLDEEFSQVTSIENPAYFQEVVLVSS
ncbi:MAG: DUF6178 family protein [Persicimonas sp.]